MSFNSIVVTEQLLKELKVKVTKGSIREKLEAHPDFPSMLAISDSISDWGVESQSYRLNKNKLDLQDLLFPFIAHLPEQGGHFILINAIIANRVHATDEHGRLELSPEELLQRWDGVALYAEGNELSGEKEYKQNRFRDFLQSLLLPLALIVGLSIGLLFLRANSFSPLYLLLGILKLAGVAISVMLLMQSISSNNPFIQNLCGLAGKNDCNAILKSDAAKVTPWLSWSEVGFFYFTGSLLCLLLAPSSLFLLALLHILALPYTLYSITYQYRHKNWCILCCAVQVLLWLEFFTHLSFGTYALSFNLSPFSFVPLVISFLSPILIWAFLKPFFLQASQLEPIKHQLKKFKYNSELFYRALTNQPSYEVSDELMPVVFGNPEAETVVTMVSNPFCGPCGKAHQTLDEWLRVRTDLQLKIVFTTANHDDDERTKVAKHISALTTFNDAKLVEDALNDWYAQSIKRYETWAEKYPVTFNGEMNEVMEKQKQWCEGAEITFTPTILVNGYKLPEPYRLEDVKYLLG